MSRYRPKAGQVLIDLLYGMGDHINRTNGLQINISKMAASLHMRPVRLIAALEWLFTNGLVAKMHLGRYTADLELLPPRKIIEVTVDPITPEEIKVIDTQMNTPKKYGW